MRRFLPSSSTPWRVMTPLALLLLALIPATTLRAEGPSDEAARNAAKTHLAEGNKRFEAGDHAAALRAYEQAYAAFPSPKIFFNLAEAHRNLGHDPEAADNYQRFLEQGGQDPKGEIYKEAKRHLDALDKKLGRIAVTGDAGAAVEIGGKPAGTLPVATIRVAPGEHEVVVKREGFEPFRARVKVDAGGSQAVVAKLEPSKTPPVAATPPIATAPPPTPPAVTAEAPPPSGGDGEGSVLGKWWFWAAVVVVAGAGAGVAIAASGGESFDPSGELGFTKTSDWRQVQ